MLKKQCPPWGLAQTEVVKLLKVIAQLPPPLRIPTTGQRILQTYASDDYWSAILLEEINGVRYFCAHASGQFKESEKNYHVIYKEILAVKYGIKIFKFHLISHKFLINMRSLKNSFCSQILSRYSIAIWIIFPNEMLVMLILVAVSFL